MARIVFMILISLVPGSLCALENPSSEKAPSESAPATQAIDEERYTPPHIIVEPFYPSAEIRYRHIRDGWAFNAFDLKLGLDFCTWHRRDREARYIGASFISMYETDPSVTSRTRRGLGVHVNYRLEGYEFFTAGPMPNVDEKPLRKEFPLGRSSIISLAFGAELMYVETEHLLANHEGGLRTGINASAGLLLFELQLSMAKEFYSTDDLNEFGLSLIFARPVATFGIVVGWRVQRSKQYRHNAFVLGLEVKI